MFFDQGINDRWGHYVETLFLNYIPNCKLQCFFVLFCFRVIFHLIVSFVLFHFNLTNLADEAKWSLNTLICRRSQVRIAIPMIELGSKINISGLNANKRKGWRPSEQNIKYGQNKNNKKI